MQILENGLHYGEACRLWLRSEDNDSVGLTLLPTLFAPLSPNPSLPIPRFSKEPHLRQCEKLAEGVFDLPVMRHCVTGLRHRYLVSHSKKRLVETLLTQLQLEYFTTQYSPPPSKGSLMLPFVCMWMWVVLMFAFLKNVFHAPLIWLLICLPSLLKVRPRFTKRSESTSFYI